MNLRVQLLHFITILRFSYGTMISIVPASISPIETMYASIDVITIFAFATVFYS